jgi:hypothetical protein
VTEPVIASCAGLWRRTLLIDADGSHDASTGVRWLQGMTAYVDSRGFAGRLRQRGDVFEWHRDVDLEPPGAFPDAGRMRWDGAVLIESGVHEDYVEHWVRDQGGAGPVGAAFVRSPDGAEGLLLRVGDHFGWAGGSVVTMGPLDGPEWTALAITPSADRVEANGVLWTVHTSEGDLGW